MKPGWVIKKLGELSKNKDAVVSGPFGSNLKVSDYKTKGIPILRLQNIGKGYFINKDIKYINEEKAKELKYHSYISGDIALAKLGIPIGKTCIIPNYLNSGIITADIVRIRPDKNVVDYNFLEYYLNTDLSVSQLTGNISGATRPRVNLSDVRNIEIPLPPLLEQKQIVSILDKAFTAIDKAKANTEKNLQNVKELFESYLQNVFAHPGEDWEERRFGDVCEYDKTPNNRKNLPYVGLEHIESNSGIFLGSKNPTSVKSSTFYFTKSHLLYGRLRPYLNKVLLPDFDGHCSTEIFPIKVHNDLDNRFLYYWLTLSTTVKKINATWTGARMPRANMNSVLDFTFKLPKLNEQISIVNKLVALSRETKKLESIYQQKLNDLEELKKSILQMAFSGKLTAAKELTV